MAMTIALVFVLVFLMLVVFIGEFGMWILLGIGVYTIFKKVLEYMSLKYKSEQDE